MPLQSKSTITNDRREILQRLAAAGKPTRLTGQDLKIAKSLANDGLVFMIRDTDDAIITPKGRHLLADEEIDAKRGRKPFGVADQ